MRMMRMLAIRQRMLGARQHQQHADGCIETLNPNPKPETLNPKPETLNPKRQHMSVQTYCHSVAAYAHAWIRCMHAYGRCCCRGSAHACILYQAVCGKVTRILLEELSIL
jgi:hypothetical protein